MRLEVEEQLVYPLLDLDDNMYTGPEGMHLSPELDRRLRDLQTRWQELQYLDDNVGPDDEDAHLACDFDAVETDLAIALQGTGWVLIKRGERTEEDRRRRRKSKRKRR